MAPLTRNQSLVLAALDQRASAMSAYDILDALRPSGLRALLVNDPEQFVGTITEKLLAYALGRGVEYYDYPTVRKIARGAAATDYQWSSIVLGIVESPPFQMRSEGS